MKMSLPPAAAAWTNTFPGSLGKTALYDFCQTDHLSRFPAKRLDAPSLGGYLFSRPGYQDGTVA